MTISDFIYVICSKMSEKFYFFRFSYLNLFIVSWTNSIHYHPILIWSISTTVAKPVRYPPRNTEDEGLIPVKTWGCILQ